ncbi:hypothetical protein ACVMGE_005066 [Bradyrhizobium diazoefficiens]
MNAINWPAATPGMPNCFTPNRPSPSVPPSAIWSTLAPISVIEGRRMSPVPRITEASVLTSQIATAPENSTCE